MVLGLDMRFLGQKREKKITAKTKAIDSFALPFGLRSSLRQSGTPLRGWFDAGLKRRSLPKTKTKAKGKATAKDKAKSNTKQKSQRQKKKQRQKGKRKKQQ